MVRCPSCGVEITIDKSGRTKFCPDCGQKLPEIPQSKITLLMSLNNAKNELAAGRNASAKKFAEDALSIDNDSPDAWFFKGCACLFTDRAEAVECLERSRKLSVSRPFEIADKEAIEQTFSSILPPERRSEAEYQSIFGPAEEGIIVSLSQGGSVCNSVIDAIIGRFRDINAKYLSCKDVIDYADEKFKKLESELKFNESLTEDNWVNVVNAATVIIPKMIVCFAADLRLANRLYTAIKSLYAISQLKWMSPFRPSSIRSVSTKAIAPIITRIRVLNDWANAIEDHLRRSPAL